MFGTLNAIYNRLVSSPELLAFLAENAPFFDEKKDKNTQNSIIPAGAARRETLTPFLTVQEGVLSRVDYHLFNQTIYIRVYNDRDSTFVLINQISEIIIGLLDRYDFNLGSNANVLTTFDSMLNSAQDEVMDMNFRELHFMMKLL